MLNWKKQNAWVLRHTRFSIEVNHIPRNEYDGNRWFVYAYIYPSHPLFQLIEAENIFDPVLGSLTLHGGCTYNSWCRDSSGKVISKKIGCDYQHEWDNYGDYDEKDVGVIFYDAEILCQELENWRKEDV